MDWWVVEKLRIMAAIGLEKDALHVHASILIMFAVAFFCRSGLRSPLPWLAVLIAELANEYADIKGHGGFSPINDRAWDASLHDVYNTMAVPTFIFLMAWAFPWLWTGWRKPKAIDRADDQRVEPQDSETT
jgi:hypothetical protein